MTNALSSSNLILLKLSRCTLPDFLNKNLKLKTKLKGSKYKTPGFLSTDPIFPFKSNKYESKSFLSISDGGPNIEIFKDSLCFNAPNKYWSLFSFATKHFLTMVAIPIALFMGFHFFTPDNSSMLTRLKTTPRCIFKTVEWFLRMLK